MTLDALDAELDGLRAQAANIQRNVGHQRDAIQADPNLTEEGKKNAIVDVTAQAKTSATALRERELALIKGQIRTLETKLDGKVGYGTSDLIAFRDAQDRAERIDSKEAADRLMGLALRNNDRTLAHALFRKSMENGWTSVAGQFAAENPDAATAAKEIEILNHSLNEGGFQRALSYMVNF